MAQKCQFGIIEPHLEHTKQHSYDTVQKNICIFAWRFESLMMPSSFAFLAAVSNRICTSFLRTIDNYMKEPTTTVNRFAILTKFGWKSRPYCGLSRRISVQGSYNVGEVRKSQKKSTICWATGTMTWLYTSKDNFSVTFQRVSTVTLKMHSLCIHRCYVYCKSWI